MKSYLVLGFLLSAFAGLASANADLVIHSEELGVGKFHRYDNSVHAYSATSAWTPYILPQGANPSTDQPLVQKNTDGSYTVFFSTLDQLLSSVIQISASTGQKVSVLNVHGHGLPGGMWFPQNDAVEASDDCSDWVTAATGSDKDNYDQYYSPVSVEDVEQIRAISNDSSFSAGCTTGLPEWQTEVAKYPQFKGVFASNAQIHFLSCVVGLGNMGEIFTTGIANLLLPAGQGLVETSVDFGLGDWSMPQGMGFWDYQTDDQLNHDNSIYPTDRKDAEIAQKGTIRRVSYSSSSWVSEFLTNQDFLPLSFQTGPLVPGVSSLGVPSPGVSSNDSVNGPTDALSTQLSREALPAMIRVPGTGAYVPVRSR